MTANGPGGESFTFKAFVGRRCKRYATLTETTKRTQKAGPLTQLCLLAQTTNRFPSRPQPRVCGRRDLERGRSVRRSIMQTSEHINDADDPNGEQARIAGCPAVSISVHPRGWTKTDAKNGVSRPLSPEYLPVSCRVHGVHPPNRPIAQGARVCAHALRTMGESKGWTPRTGLSAPSNPGRREPVVGESVSTPRGGHKWTGVDRVSTPGGERAW